MLPEIHQTRAKIDNPGEFRPNAELGPMWAPLWPDSIGPNPSQFSVKVLPESAEVRPTCPDLARDLPHVARNRPMPRRLPRVSKEDRPTWRT